MLYYIVMSEKNPFGKNKPIDEIRDTLESLVTDIKGMKTELTRMKEYVRKLEVREQLKDEKEKQVEKEYVQPSGSWFW
jgi:hypothetical protein